MAKSLRSQRVRKMKTIRRNTYFKGKELERLKTMVAATKKRELAAIANVVTAEARRSRDESYETVEDDCVTSTEVSMRKEKKYNKTNMKDGNGQYPIWLHPRKIRKLEGKNNRKAKALSRKKVGSRSRRRT